MSSYLCSPLPRLKGSLGLFSRAFHRLYWLWRRSLPHSWAVRMARHVFTPLSPSWVTSVSRLASLLLSPLQPSPGPLLSSSPALVDLTAES
jgi:hypothetical protein